MNIRSEEQLRRLDALVGTWSTTIVLLNPDGTEGEVSTAMDIYRWMSNGHFLLHDVDAVIGGQPVQSMEVIAVDPQGTGYVTQSYDADGSINNFTARLEGLSWQIHGREQRFSGAFSHNGQLLSGRWEQRQTDNWLPLMTVKLRKQAM
jgi:hypothetical protein